MKILHDNINDDGIKYNAGLGTTCLNLGAKASTELARFRLLKSGIYHHKNYDKENHCITKKSLSTDQKKLLKKLKNSNFLMIQKSNILFKSESKILRRFLDNNQEINNKTRNQIKSSAKTFIRSTAVEYTLEDYETPDNLKDFKSICWTVLATIACDGTGQQKMATWVNKSRTEVNKQMKKALGLTVVNQFVELTQKITKETKTNISQVKAALKYNQMDAVKINANGQAVRQIPNKYQTSINFDFQEDKGNIFHYSNKVLEIRADKHIKTIKALKKINKENIRKYTNNFKTPIEALPSATQNSIKEGNKKLYAISGHYLREFPKEKRNQLLRSIFSNPLNSMSKRKNNATKTSNEIYKEGKLNKINNSMIRESKILSNIGLKPAGQFFYRKEGDRKNSISSNINKPLKIINDFEDYNEKISERTVSKYKKDKENLLKHLTTRELNKFQKSKEHLNSTLKFFNKNTFYESKTSKLDVKNLHLNYKDLTDRRNENTRCKKNGCEKSFNVYAEKSEKTVIDEITKFTAKNINVLKKNVDDDLFQETILDVENNSTRHVSKKEIKQFNKNVKKLLEYQVREENNDKSKYYFSEKLVNNEIKVTKHLYVPNTKTTGLLC